MKINQIILAVVLGLGMSGQYQANAACIVGPDTISSIVYQTMITPGAVFINTPKTTLYGGGSNDHNAGGSARYMTFEGVLVGDSYSETTFIDCAWLGSERGISDAIGVGNNYGFETIPDGATTYVNKSNQTVSVFDGKDHGTNYPGFDANSYWQTHGNFWGDERVTLAFTDYDQAFSRTPNPIIANNAVVCVVPFKWVRNNGVWNGTNVTDFQIRQALGGFCPRAVFSGNSADTTDFVYVSGRDRSGGGANAFAETGWGVFTSTRQIELDGTGNIVNLDGLGTYAGDFGFTFGSDLAVTLGTSTAGKNDPQAGTTGAGFSVIAYLSVGDAGTTIAAGAQELTYNGVLFSPAAVKEGTYTFWGNEYIFVVPINGGQITYSDKLLYDRLVSTIPAHCDGVTAIKLSDMHCSRSGPNSDPSHN